MFIHQLKLPGDSVDGLHETIGAVHQARRDYVECQATDLEAHEDKPGPWQQAHRAEFASLLVDPSHAKRVWRGLIEEGIKPLSRLKLG
ncbi:hypothetical protein CKO28_26410 [Rhodovibrio sodomensis]|uniref:Uncharacterized protein n=1 Tax=Rhodovibrio sodomensis TaxID=1088 RepID=A0ABS1DLW5_9PROT|nr:hypothetical protein [Rhodovibrio sodomensis]MBK1671536.1 hypothetical protein [Rhodovibrio sodomensis]